MRRDGTGSPGIWVALLALAGLALWWAADPKGVKPVAAPAVSNRSAASPVSPENADPRERSVDAPPRREAAADTLRREVPGVRIDFDAITGGPKHIMAVGRFLDPLPGRAYEAVSRFVDSHRELFGHDSAALAGGNSRITREDTTAHSGLKTVVWQQELDGIPFFQTILRANLGGNGELVALGGNFLGDPASATRLDPRRRASLIANPPVAATRAVVLAAADIDAEVDEKSVTRTDGPQGVEKRQDFKAPAISDTRAGLAWVPTGPDSARLAWDVTLMSLRRGEMFRVLVDAENGGVLVRQGLTNYISDATYRVFANAVTAQPRDSPTPFSPGHPTPLTTQPPTVARELVTIDALNANASPAGWINDGGTQTLGNNVDAHADSDADANVPDLPRPTSATRNFDFPLDFANAPAAYKDAAVTQLFYLSNWVHDKLYELGFTETAGNFQTNNFTRGGLGNDAVLADAQDGGGTNNANFSTPPDGSPGRMQMYVFTGPTPAIDGDLDAEIVIHEYVHGLSNRLVGGGVGISEVQSRGMGEGWSDFYGLALLSESGDDIHGAYAAGGYATRQFGSLTQNYYFGIRRFPYSTDLLKNPLTFKDIDPALASSHAGVPRSPVIGNTAGEVHNQGEVWCAALWDMRANLIARHGFATGNPLALRLVTDGMKLCPADPDFLQARDAIIQADLVANAGANRNELWTAFAKRGMGAGASSPAASTTSGVGEAYDVPDDLGVTPFGTFEATGQAGGAITPASRTFTLANNGAAGINWTATRTQPWLALSASGGALAPGATATVTATFTSAAGILAYGAYTDSITFTNTASGATLVRPVSLTVEPFYDVIFADDFESGSLAFPWSITGTSTHRTVISTVNAPHAGARHLTMDSGADDSYARNEATLTLDLTGRENLVLSFWVKMFNDESHAPATNPFNTGADFDGVAVSNDGGTVWHEIRDLRSLSNTWGKISVDLDAAVAARGLTYTSNFKIRFNHYDNYSISTDGFAFDDILVAEPISNRLSLFAPDSAAEGGSPANAVLAVVPVSSQPLTVSLSSNSPEASVPASVTIPADTGSVVFSVTPTDDLLLDGSKSVVITATAQAFPAASTAIVIHDNETTVLTVDLPETLGEGGPAATGSVTTGVPVDTAVEVALASGNPALLVPASVFLPAGATSVSFSIVSINDNQINGSRPAEITATVTGWTSGADTLTILDDETSVLTLTLPRLREGDTGQSATATISGTLPFNLTVALTCDDPAELTVPASVTIPAGQTGTTIPLTIVDDADTDGGQTVILSATAAGFPDASATRVMEDNDAHHFSIATINGPVLRNAPVAVTITAEDINGVAITNFTRPLTLAAAGVPLTPTTAGGFTDGVLTVQVTFTGYATGAVLTASDGAGPSGTSNAFDIVAGPLDHFAWDAVPSPQPVDAPFPATLRALDLAGNPVTAFAGQAALSAVIPERVEILSWTAYADVTAGGEYDHTKQAIANHFTNFRETSTTTLEVSTLAGLLAGKHVFLIVEQETGTTQTLGVLGTAWAGVLGNFVTAGGTVIACSNTTSEHLFLTNSGLLNLTPVSSPSSITVTKTQETLLNAGVPASFPGSYLHTYTTTNGVVDLQTSTNQPVVISRTYGAGRVVLVGTDFNTLGTPMDRVIANAVALAAGPNSSALPVAPATTGDFTAGVWSGDITVPFAATGVKLRATAGALTADSNEFAVGETVLVPGTDTGLTFSLPPEISEGGGTAIGSVNLLTAMPTDLTVNLVSKSPAKLSVPATVVIPAGQVSAEFLLTITDDAFVDGVKNVVIAASATGHPEIQTVVRVMDNDGGSLGLTLPAGVPENAGGINGTVSLGAPALSPVVIALTSDLPTAAQPTASVTIPRGATTATFAIAIPDDGMVDGNQTVSLTATAPGWTPVTVGLAILDNESRALALSIPPVARESDAPKTGIVTLGGNVAADLVISLTSNDSSEITVPASVTIPAGQSSVTFALTIQDDPAADGPQPFTVTASAATFLSATASGIVRDNDADHFTFAPIGSPMLRNGPVPAIITARDGLGAVIADYNSPISLSAAGDTGPLTLAVTGAGFLHGTWSGSVQIDALASNIVLTASDGLGHTGSGNPFDLIDGAIDRFEWNAVPSPAAVDTPFTATLRAVDAVGATVAGYQGIANLFLLAPSQNPETGTGGTTSPYGLITYTHDSRGHTLYTAEEIGGAARITALAYKVTTLGSGGQTLDNLKIRLKQTPLATLAGFPGWDNTGWTTVYQSSPVIAATGWVTFTFATPFDFAGTGNLLVDLSMDRTATNSSSTFVQASNTAQPLALCGTSNSTHGDPLAWAGTTPPLVSIIKRPDVRFTTAKELPLRPARSGVFANGVWTGEISLPVSGNGLALRARAGAVTGTGNAFDVTGPTAPPDGGLTVLSEDFESGSLNPARWTSTGTGNFRTVVTSSYTPHGGVRHLAMDTTSSAARNEATLTLNLAGRSGVVLDFWAAGFNDEPNGPPASPFTGGADFDGVAMSANGTTWWEIQGLRSLPGTYGRFTVDLDAAIAARGISYGPTFKIRFNHYDDNPLTTDGIVIDDILVTASATSGFTLTAPAQLMEGGAPAAAGVLLETVAATDTVVALTSGAPAKIVVPASVTVPAGQLAAPFSLTLPDDGIADGNRSVTLTGTVPGKPPRGVAVTVLDDETLPFTLTTPATVAEGSTGHTGTLTLGAAAAGDITIRLVSSDPADLTVPAEVSFAPGETRAVFPITVVNDTRIDGTRTTTLTASVPGWLDASSTIQVTDNETRALTISPPVPLFEGAFANGSVTLSGTLAENLTVNLASSDPAQYVVSATVTIPAGQTSAPFTGIAVEDTAFDGTRSAVLTASSAGFTSGSATAFAYDNDVHHFGFQTVASPRKSGVPFTISVTAQDINNVVITPFTGAATLTAAGDGGPVALTPTGPVTFVSGTWSGAVTCALADTNVRITATGSGAAGTSNLFEVQLSPAITTAPAAISLTLNQGQSATRNLAITNTGGGTLAWSIATSAPLTEASATAVSLAKSLANLNANHGLVRAMIPGRFDFTDGITGTSINDGGNDMYDTGNILNTNFGTALTYSDNVILASTKLGAGGQYFTRKFAGLWVFAADVAGLGYFEITGNLGADGSGSTDATVLTLTRNGTTWRGFVKRVFNAYDPSVNHLVIIEDNGTATHLTTTDTNNDYHRLTGLAGVTRIYDLLYAGTGGAYIDNPATLNIMTAFIDAVSVPDWIGTSVTSGNVAAGATAIVPLDISAANLTAGTYARTLFINSNDVALPQTSVPVSLTVTNNGSLAVTPALPLLATGPRGGPFPPASGTYTLTNTGGTALDWTAGKSASWVGLSASSGALAPGGSTTVTATINPTAASLPSGVQDAALTFTNTTYGHGDTTRPVTLTVTPAAEMTVTPPDGFESGGSSGGPFSPAEKTYLITNPGDADLTWSAGHSAPWLQLSVTGGTLAPGASQAVSATLDAATADPGQYAGTLSFTNTANGRGDTSRVTALEILPPAPQFTAVPAYAPGSSITLTWNVVASAVSYEVQAATDPGFSNLVATASHSDTSHVFHDLGDGTLHHFRVRAIHDSTASPWSAPASSTQDASPPVLVRSSPATSASAIIVPQGGATDTGAGVATITVNGRPAKLTAGTWTAEPLLLLPGENTLTVTASDCLSPPNIRTESWTVAYTGPATTDADGDKLPDTWESSHGLNPADNGTGDPLQGAAADPDGDQIANLLEYALGLDPAVRDASGLPTATLEIRAGDGKQFLTFHHRRRILPGNLHYRVETTTTPDSAAWDDSGAGLEEISSPPTGDGVTELRSVRILPATDIIPRKFVRLKVVTD